MAIGDPGLLSTNPDLAACTVFFGRSTFLGRSLVSALLDSGRWAVRVAETLPPLDRGPIHQEQAEYFQIDVADVPSLRPVVAGAVAVFLVDPLPPFPSPSAIVDFPRLHALSVIGAKNLVDACRQSGVRRLVYTGSTDVVFDGKNDIRLADESWSYPDKYEDPLNELRMQVEMVVLSANGKDGLLTCALRPSITFGPGDENFVSSLLEEARSGRAKFVVGNGKNICDLTYVENVVHANISAERALSSGQASVAGKPFFITNDKPVELWEFISNILENMGYRRPKLNVSVNLAKNLMLLFNKISKNKLNVRTFSNSHSPAAACFLSCSRTFNCAQAKALLGYSPIVSFQEGIKLTVQSLPQLAKNLNHSGERDLTIASKADRMLGSGPVADILLWRDEKKTFAFVVTSFVLFYWLFLSGRTFITSSAKILVVVCISLFIQGFLPSEIFGSNIEKIPSSCFKVSESTMRNVFFALASLWNEGSSALKSLARGDDWSIFFKAAGSLYLVKVLLHFPISVLVGLGLTCLFSVFIIYEQCKEEVDKLKGIAALGIESLKKPLVARLPKFLTEFLSVRKV